jgi:hypothetical protein
MNNIRLPINENPKIKGFNNVAFCMGVLDATGIDYRAWLVNNYLKICHKKRWDAITINKYNLISNSCFKKRLCVSLSATSIIEKMKNALLMGYYIYICVDEKYIPNRFNYNHSKKLHDIYISGIDFENSTFTAWGYNEKLIYSKQELSFDCLKRAIVPIVGIRYYIAFKPKEGYNFQKIDYANLLKTITNQIKSETTSQCLSSVFAKLRDTKANASWLDTRDIRTIYEHSIIVSMLGEICNLNGFIENIKRSEQMLLLSIKYNIKRSAEMIDKIINLIKTIFCEENKNLMAVLPILKEQMLHKKKSTFKFNKKHSFSLIKRCIKNIVGL